MSCRMQYNHIVNYSNSILVNSQSGMDCDLYGTHYAFVVGECH